MPPPTTRRELNVHWHMLNGLRLLTKGGDTILFHSMLALIPEKNAGVFITYNSSSALRPHDQVLQPFLDHFFPSVERPFDLIHILRP